MIMKSDVYWCEKPSYVLRNVLLPWIERVESVAIRVIHHVDRGIASVSLWVRLE